MEIYLNEGERVHKRRGLSYIRKDEPWGIVKTINNVI